MKTSSIFIICIVVYAVFLYAYQGVFQPRSGRKTDFESYYCAAVLLRQGGDPYNQTEMNRAAADLNAAHYDRGGQKIVNAYVYPPFLAAVLYPLSFLSISNARVVWSCGCNVFFLLVLVYYFYLIFKKIEVVTLGFCLLAFSTPLYKTLAMGQVNVLLLLLVVAVYYYFQKSAEIRFALCLAAGILVKVVPIIFIVLVLRSRKQWRWLLSLGVILMVLVAATMAVSPVRLYKKYALQVFPGFASAERPQVKNQSLRRSCIRLFGDSRGVRFGVWVIKAAMLLFMAFIVLKKIELLYTFNLLLVTVLLLQNTLWEHHLLLAVFPVLALLVRSAEEKKICVFLGVCIAYAIMAVNYKFYDSRLADSPFHFLQSAKFLGVFILYICYVVFYFNEKPDRNLELAHSLYNG